MNDVVTLMIVYVIGLVVILYLTAILPGKRKKQKNASDA